MFVFEYSAHIFSSKHVFLESCIDEFHAEFDNKELFKNSITFQANSNYQSAQNQETFAGLPSLRQYRIPDFRSRRSYHEINPRAFLNAEKVCKFLLWLW